MNIPQLDVSVRRQPAHALPAPHSGFGSGGVVFAVTPEACDELRGADLPRSDRREPRAWDTDGLPRCPRPPRTELFIVINIGIRYT